ncbi:MAG: ribosome biogenesis GTPase Der [Thermodesulfobacteriota bacterium]
MSALIAIVGRPNVGKSTLFNRLVGRPRAIVDDQAGVTRDRNYAPVKVGGRPAVLVDTGGFDADDRDGLPALVREQTLLAIEEADLVVLLADGKEGLNPHDRDLVQVLRRADKPFLLAVNKIDGPEKEALLTEFYELGEEEVLPLSAAHGFGVPGLLDRLAERLPPAVEEAGVEDHVRVAVIGRPNVGKSSLVNRLLGRARILVTDTPGTTRDPVDVLVERAGRRYLFVDTAGIRRKGRVSLKIEKFAVMRALRVLERCDVALLLADAAEGVTDQDAHVAGYAFERGRGLIVVFNKWDLVEDKKAAQGRIRDWFDLKLRFLNFAPYLTASAKTGLRVEKIFDVIDQVFAQYTSRFPTAQVNRVLEKAVQAHTPPYAGRGRLKFFYATQVSDRPPTFVVFTNKPEKVHFSYRRYLANSFQEAFGLDKVPVRVIFKSRHKDER